MSLWKAYLDIQKKLDTLWHSTQQHISLHFLKDAKVFRNNNFKKKEEKRTPER